MKILRFAIAPVLIGFALPSMAQTAPDARLREQLRQTTLQLRQLQDENAGMKARLDALGAGSAAAVPAAKPAEVEELQRQLRQEQAKGAALRRELDASESNLAAWKQSYEQIAAQAREKGTEARRFELESQQAQAASRQTSTALQDCVSDNARLVRIGDELVVRYRDKGLWSAMRDAEPLLGLSKIEFEKLAQEYRGRIIDATVVQPVADAAQP